jgi:uncharacterized protein (TIGR03000 family)
MSRLLLSVSLFALLLALPAPAVAQRRIIYRPTYRPIYPGHMPGWDWWRTYPWSPYNYGRNPYNPAFVPYPYYVSPYGYPVYAPPVAPGMPDGSVYPTPDGGVVVPHPVSGWVPAPANAAVIEAKLPDTFAQVLFDGEQTSSIGDVRYYVSPELPPGREHQYTMTASWNTYSGRVTRQRVVNVQAGHTTVVDFTRP